MLNELKSENLKLSFNFVITKYEARVIDMDINGYLAEVKKGPSFFDWFMEDLIFFLDKNRFQRRWDYHLVRLHNIESLGLNEEELNTFKRNLKTVTSWDMEVADESNSI